VPDLPPADDRPWARPVLIVGQGLIGAPLGALLQAGGWPVACVSRYPGAQPDCRAHDLATAPGREGLRGAIQQIRPRLIVLTHGPRDVTWVQEHEDEAAAVHCGAAEVAAASGVPAVMISTDHVFAGNRGGYRPSDRVGPASAYGRVKVRAEELIMAASGLVVRLSLVYGWPGPGRPATFAGRCLIAASRDLPMIVPTDQMFTPVHVSDVAAVLAVICSLPQPLSGIRHLAGPREVSRFDFATLAYQLAGARPGLVRPCRRADSPWAAGLAFTSLECSEFSDLAGLESWQPLPPEAGLSMMLAAAGEECPGVAAAQ
jgi:dTDP-4-dehydrorhamnose reductase